MKAYIEQLKLVIEEIEKNKALRNIVLQEFKQWGK